MASAKLAEPSSLASAPAAGYAQFAIVYIFGLVTWAAVGMLGPLSQRIAADAHIPLSAVGVLLGTQYVPGALAGVVTGWLADRFGPKAIMLAGCVTIALSSLPNLFLTDVYLIGVDLFIQGLAIAGVLSSALAFVAISAKGGQVRLLSIWATVNFVGLATGQFLAAAFVGSESWRRCFLVLAALNLAAALLGLLLPRVVVEGRREPITRVLGEGSVVATSFAMGVAALVGVGTNIGAATYFHMVHGVSLGATAAASSFGVLLGISGSVIGGTVISRNVDLRLVAGAISLIGLATGLVLYLPGIGFSAALATLYAFQINMSALVAFIYITLPRFVSHRTLLGSASGLLFQVGHGGAMLGPPVFYALFAMGMWSPIAATMVISWAATAALLLYAASPKARGGPP